MNASIREPKVAAQHSVVLERVFTAPRELLFRLFTEPEHLVRWWCPYPLTFPVCEFDARPGGSFRQVMQTSDGTRFPYLGTVVEVDPPNRVVFSSAEDVTNSEAPGTEVLNTITFTQQGDQTLVRVRIDVVKACATTADTLRGMEVGWMQDFGRLEFYLLSWPGAGGSQRGGTSDGQRPFVTTPSDREIVITLTVDAPPLALFNTLIDPELIPRWWGPENETTTVVQMDVRPGGKWRFLQHQPTGESLEYSGEYFLIVPSDLIVNSFETGRLVEPTPFDQLRIDAVHLHSLGGRTLLARISLFPSEVERDRALDAGFVNETTESYERLARLLPALV